MITDREHRLVPDIQLLTTPEFDRETLASKLQLNTGSQRLNSETNIVANYIHEAVIPRSDWHELNAEDVQCLISSDREWQSGANIGVIRIPDAELALLRQTLVIRDRGSGDNDRPLYAIVSEDVYQQALDRLVSYLQPYLVDRISPIKSLGINASLPGLITTTRDLMQYLPETPYVGLHLDSWEKAPLKRRHLSNNRLCINIGQETRYFLFINLSLMQIFKMLQLRDPQDLPTYYRGTNLAELFLQTYPNYPVCKLALAPNEAYIAPTENMLHDATSIDKQDIDLSLTFLGKFWIPTVTA